MTVDIYSDVMPDAFPVELDAPVVVDELLACGCTGNTVSVSDFSVVMPLVVWMMVSRAAARFVTCVDVS